MGSGRLFPAYGAEWVEGVWAGRGMEGCWAEETVLGAGTRAGVGVGVRTGTEERGGNPQRWRRGVGVATAELIPEPEKEPGAQHLTQRRPLMAPRESNAISIFGGGESV